TNGFRAHNEFIGNNAYTKLSYDLTMDTSAIFTMGYNNFTRGVSEVPSFDLFINNSTEIWSSSLSIHSRLNDETTADLSIWHLRQDAENYNNQLSTGFELSNGRYIDDGYGSSAKLIWKYGQQNIVAGVDYVSKRLTSNTIAGGEKELTETAFFINDTVTIGHLSMTPGVRYDQTNTNGDFTSPSFGATYKLTNTTLLRGYIAKAFTLPPLSATYGDNITFLSNPGLKMEEVVSYEAGLETTALPYLWLKLSVFKHDMTNGITTVAATSTTFTAVNEGKEQRQGLEAELKTEPLFHTSLYAGAAFMNAKDPSTGQTIQDVPQRTYDVGLRFDDNSLRALISGHSIDWNSEPGFNGKYSSFIFDFHIAKNLRVCNLAVEAFADIHNIFSDSQYAIDTYKNPGRWVEAGVRYLF
ncbi:MAG TPA: TonB-dependent receptor, partial [Nitrospirota bacterium]|nr:TonB-dependent receptor [Nitrospirota bacterium]